MLDQGVPASTPVIADNGASRRATSVPHARWLRISVTRHGRVVVQVCFPVVRGAQPHRPRARGVRVRVVAEHVDLDMVAADAAARGCPAGELFAITSGEHGVRAWLD